MGAIVFEPAALGGLISTERSIPQPTISLLDMSHCHPESRLQGLYTSFRARLCQSYLYWTLSKTHWYQLKDSHYFQWTLGQIHWVVPYLVRSDRNFSLLSMSNCPLVIKLRISFHRTLLWGDFMSLKISQLNTIQNVQNFWKLMCMFNPGIWSYIWRLLGHYSRCRVELSYYSSVFHIGSPIKLSSK